MAMLLSRKVPGQSGFEKSRVIHGMNISGICGSGKPFKNFASTVE
jgi:hypothetical protein